MATYHIVELTELRMTEYNSMLESEEPGWDILPDVLMHDGKDSTELDADSDHLLIKRVELQ